MSDYTQDVRIDTLWRVKHASGTTYAVMAGSDHASAISAAERVERYKCEEDAEMEGRTFRPSPIVELERQWSVYRPSEPLLDDYKQLTAELRDMLDEAGFDTKSVGLTKALRRVLDVIAASAGDDLR